MTALWVAACQSQGPSQPSSSDSGQPKQDMPSSGCGCTKTQCMPQTMPPKDCMKDDGSSCNKCSENEIKQEGSDLSSAVLEQVEEVAQEIVVLDAVIAEELAAIADAVEAAPVLDAVVAP